MKKIRLNLANLEGTEILSREQLKSIIGGTYYTCTKRKDHVSETVEFGEVSDELVAAWESVWQGFGWSTSCTNMPIADPNGSGSGSSFT